MEIHRDRLTVLGTARPRAWRQSLGRLAALAVFGGVSLGAAVGVPARHESAAKTTCVSPLIERFGAVRSLQAGKRATLQFVVKNSGRVRSAPTRITVGILAAKAARFPANGIGSARVPALAPGARGTISVHISMFFGHPSGPAELTACLGETCTSRAITVTPVVAYPKAYVGDFKIDSTRGVVGSDTVTLRSVTGTMRWERVITVPDPDPRIATYKLVSGRASVAVTGQRTLADGGKCVITGSGEVMLPTGDVRYSHKFTLVDSRTEARGDNVSAIANKTVTPFYYSVDATVISRTDNVLETETCDTRSAPTGGFVTQVFDTDQRGGFVRGASMHSANVKLLAGTYEAASKSGFPGGTVTKWSLTAAE